MPTESTSFMDYANNPDSPNCIFCNGDYPSEDSAFRMKVWFKDGYVPKWVISCPVCLYEKILVPDVLPYIIKIENLGPFIGVNKEKCIYCRGTGKLYTSNGEESICFNCNGKGIIN